MRSFLPCFSSRAFIVSVFFFFFRLFSRCCSILLFAFHSSSNELHSSSSSLVHSRYSRVFCNGSLDSFAFECQANQFHVHTSGSGEHVLKRFSLRIYGMDSLPGAGGENRALRRRCRSFIEWQNE